MAKYKLTEGTSVIRISDGAAIPADPFNRDYREYLSDVEAGETPIPYVAPPAPIPEEISDRQFFQQLAIEGLITESEALSAVQTGVVPAAIQSIIDAMPEEGRFSANMLLSGATVFKRSHPLTEAFGQAIGKKPDQIDAIWLAAALL